MCLSLLVGFGILMFLSYFCLVVHASPMSCSASLSESCHASLYFVPGITKSLNETASLFGVGVNFVSKTKDGFLIEISCSCPADHNEFVWHMDYVVQPRDTWESVSSKFGSFVLPFPEKTLLPSLHVTLDLLCGCSGSGEMVSYKVKKGDTLYTICSRFKADLDKTARLNRLDNPDLIYNGDVIFIPVPGLQNLIMVDVDNKDLKTERKTVSRVHIIVGVVAAASVIVLSMVTLLFWKYHRRKRVQQLQESNATFQQMECLHCFLDACPYHKSSEVGMVSSLSSEKATVFPYYEICDATYNFSISSKIGQGSYGSVYLGTLRGKEVAIKQMKNTKSREFLSELNILCKVHHPNLIELIGYAAGGNSLFLVYEFAQNGALSDHLHQHRFRGCKPLSWTMRVQIALDAAKGLEYIHEHTKPYYVHRDVKTSNILLDSNFHAKIADFGLVKLLEQSPDVRTAASRIVGTFGYLAPEYVRDGCVTTKSDVYSFGVVLMELLTGQPALSQEANPENNYYEHRSLVQYVLAALNDACDPFNQLTKCIDPNLTCYHKDSFFQMALLSKDCVNDNWNQRPDMSTVVVRLSHILSCSKEWEKK